MDLDIRKANGVFVVVLAGAVRADDNTEFENALKDTRFQQAGGMILDVSKLEYLNSRAIGAILALWMELSSAGVKMFVVRPAPLVKRLLQSVGIYTLISVVESVDDAIKSIPQKD